MVLFILWLILAVVSLPLAVIALFVYPFVWLLSLPFRLVGISVKAVLETVKGIVMLPARLLGRGRGRRR